MTDADRRRLRQLFHSLSEQQRLLEAHQPPVILLPQVDLIAAELRDLARIDSDLLPRLFNPDDFFTSGVGSRATFTKAGIQAFLAAVIARLRVEIDAEESNPVTERREFPFVADSELRRIVERDYEELQRAFVARCWKSAIILSGGAIEAVLLDLLQNESRALTAGSAPKGKSDISRWDLNDLINVAVELKLVGPTVEKLSHPVREYRNLIHPGNELRSKLTFDREEARIAIEVLNSVHRDLSA